MRFFKAGRVLFFVFLTSSNVFGQNNDLNIWSRGGKSEYIWFVHYGDKIVVDGRYNYDDDKTVGFCLGKKIGPDSLAFVPEVCGYAG